MDRQQPQAITEHKQQPRPQSRARAPIPPITEPETLRALYTRVHWLVIAGMDLVIAQGVKFQMSGSRPATDPTDTLQQSLELLRERVAGYNRAHAYYMKQTDEHSLRAMQDFISNVADREAAKPDLDPMFAFLFL